MPVAIRNLTSRHLIVPLNSGTNLRLSPGEVSDDVHDVELKENSKIEKLLRQRAIAVEPREEEEGGTKAGKTAGTEGEAAHTAGVEGDGGGQKSDPV
jgi:hypothetical protein